MALLDGQVMDPRTAALLSAAFAGLQASGPSRTPTSLGQVIGAGGAAGMGAYSQAVQAKILDDYRRAQEAHMVAQDALLKQQEERERRKLDVGLGLLGSQPSSALLSPSSAALAAGAQQGSVGPTNANLARMDAIQNQPRQPQDLFSPQQVLGGSLLGLPGDLMLKLNERENPNLIHTPLGMTSPRTGQVVAPMPQTNQQGFSTMTVPDGMGGFKVVVTPGSEQAYSAQEGIRSGFETVPVTTASGATVQTFKRNLHGFPGGAVASPAPRAPQPTPANPADPWSTIPKMLTPSGIGQSTYQKGIQEKAAATSASLSEKFGTIAQENNQRMALNNQALDLIDKSDTGPGAAAIADVKNILVSRFDVPEGDFANTPSATQALQKDLLNAATQKAKQQFGARMTQSEVMLMLKRGAPNIDMTKAAMRYLIDSDNAQLKYGIQQANDLGRYLEAGGDPYRFEAWYAKNFPMAGTMSQVKLNSGRQNVDDLIRKYSATVAR